MHHWRKIAAAVAVMAASVTGALVLGTRSGPTKAVPAATTQPEPSVVRTGNEVAFGVYESELPSDPGFRLLGRSDASQPGRDRFEFVVASFRIGRLVAVAVDEAQLVWLKSTSIRDGSEERKLIGRVHAAKFADMSSLAAKVIVGEAEQPCEAGCLDCGSQSVAVADATGKLIPIARDARGGKCRTGPGAKTLISWMLAIQRAAFEAGDPWPPPPPRQDGGRD